VADETRVFHFHSDAYPDDTFQLTTLRGFEEISAPYEFTVEMQSKKADIAFDQMLTTAARIDIRQSIPVPGGKPRSRLFSLWGVLSSFEIQEKLQDNISYRAVLVPRLWKCGLTTQSRVFQEMTIEEIIKAVLTEKGGSGLTTQDFEITLTGSHSKKEFVVQYNETDLDFLHRWLEYEGIFYYFQQTDTGEKIVFNDGIDVFPRLPSDPKVPYRPDPSTRNRSAGSQEEQEQIVSQLRCRWNKTTKQVVLKDHNYRTPSVDVKAEAESKNPAAEGMLYAFGEHFKTAAEGKAIAQLRSEEMACRDKVLEGRGDHRLFRAGSVFNLGDHFQADFNAPYLLTRVEHDAKQGTAAAGKGGTMTYENEFTCIPSDVAFRPERRTEWPSIHGFVNATIDAGGSGEYAEIDDQGRYKVKLPFDLSDKKDGKASRYVRMMQPYAGGGMGMHFPLHKGTEVALGFVDGDPDRPLILGALVNPETASPVSGANSTQCKIHTGGGNSMTIEDTAGTQSITLHSPSGNTMFSMGKT